MPTIQVFDPPMCCSTGVCGGEPDPTLARFASDLDWLGRQGIVVERANLSQQPDRFVGTPVVQQELQSRGADCLPLVLVDGRILSSGIYPTREQLAGVVGVQLSTGETRSVTAKTGSCCGDSGCC